MTIVRQPELLQEFIAQGISRRNTRAGIEMMFNDATSTGISAATFLSMLTWAIV